MKAWLIALVPLTALLLPAGETFARPPGDATKGEVLAQRVCSSCHAVARSRRPSPNPQAPPFRDIARTPGMTAVALRAALQTSHRNMPDLILDKRSREDVIAYILSLKGERPARPTSAPTS